MHGPSKVSGCPQQKDAVRTTPRGGSNSGKASAAQLERGPHRDISPTSAPPANSASKNTFSAVMISLPSNQGARRAHGAASLLGTIHEPSGLFPRLAAVEPMVRGFHSSPRISAG